MPRRVKNKRDRRIAAEKLKRQQNEANNLVAEQASQQILAPEPENGTPLSIHEKKGLGGQPDGNGRDETGLRQRTSTGMIARAATWQNQNRFKLDRTKEEIEAAVKSEGATIYDEILLNALELMQDRNRRAKSIGVRAGAQLAKIVQADDHAKLKAELRPTIISPQVTIDQSTHTDNRRVMLLIPDNGRDAITSPTQAANSDGKK